MRSDVMLYISSSDSVRCAVKITEKYRSGQPSRDGADTGVKSSSVMVRQYYLSATLKRHAKIHNKKGGAAAAP